MQDISDELPDLDWNLPMENGVVQWPTPAVDPDTGEPDWGQGTEADQFAGLWTERPDSKEQPFESPRSGGGMAPQPGAASSSAGGGMAPQSGAASSSGLQRPAAIGAAPPLAIGAAPPAKRQPPPPAAIGAAPPAKTGRIWKAGTKPVLTPAHKAAPAKAKLVLTPAPAGGGMAPQPAAAPAGGGLAPQQGKRGGPGFRVVSVCTLGWHKVRKLGFAREPTAQEMADRLDQLIDVGEMEHPVDYVISTMHINNPERTSRHTGNAWEVQSPILRFCDVQVLLQPPNPDKIKNTPTDRQQIAFWIFPGIAHKITGRSIFPAKGRFPHRFHR